MKANHAYSLEFTTDTREDPDELQWTPTNPFYRDRNRTSWNTGNQLQNYREQIEENPFLRRALNLYMYYVIGSEFTVSLQPLELPDLSEDIDTILDKYSEVLTQTLKINGLCNTIIDEVYSENASGWSPLELVKRTYRDGESFTRLFNDSWPVRLRFIDPEYVGDASGEDGIITAPEDVATIVGYKIYDKQNVQKTQLSSDEVVFKKLDADSTVLRGKSRFYDLLVTGERILNTVLIETKHRNLQASIVIQKKLAGGGTNAVSVLLENSKTGTQTVNGTTYDLERIRGGSIQTLGRGIEVEFKQPDTNFSDANPLILLLISYISAITGFSLEMISGQSAKGGFGDSLSKETPVLQMVQTERQDFKPTFLRIFKWILTNSFRDEKYRQKFKDLGINSPEELWDKFRIEFLYGDVVSRDWTALNQGNNIAVMNGSISVAEASRILNKNPITMMVERILETKRPDINFQSLANQNPTADDAKKSSDGNAKAGASNQGDGSPIQHKDSKGLGGSKNK